MDRQELLWSPRHPEPDRRHDRGVVRRGAAGPRCGATPGLRSVGGGRAAASCSTASPTTCGWPWSRATGRESHLAAPDEAALRREVELAKELGFNGVRIHQKVEDPRFLYWCDRLGLLVWGEIANAYVFSPEAAARLHAGVAGGAGARLQPPVHRGLGAAERELGRAEPAARPGAAALRAGALPPDQGARPHPPGDRERRLGAPGGRHTSASTTTPSRARPCASATAASRRWSGPGARCSRIIARWACRGCAGRASR